MRRRRRMCLSLSLSLKLSLVGLLRFRLLVGIRARRTPPSLVTAAAGPSEDGILVAHDCLPACLPRRVLLLFGTKLPERQEIPTNRINGQAICVYVYIAQGRKEGRYAKHRKAEMRWEGKETSRTKTAPRRRDENWHVT